MMMKDSYSSTSSEAADTEATQVSQRPNVLLADLEALQNDLEQAKAMASDYRWQLAEKSNACAELRHQLEKSQHDLTRLQNNIGELRNERCEGAVYTNTFERLSEENDSLRREVEKLQAKLQVLMRSPQAVKENGPTEQAPYRPEQIKLDFNV